MGLINLDESEVRAISAIDMDELRTLIDQAIRDEQSLPLSRVPLRACGPYVSAKVSDFSEALGRYRAGNSAAKREDTLYYADKAGRELVFAVSQMKSRLEIEQREGQTFKVFDPLLAYFEPSEKMRVRVDYRWRSDAQSEWTNGSIEFHHEVPSDFGLPTFGVTTPKRKPSRAAVLEARRRRLHEEWEHLLQLGHWAVRDYFRDGKAGGDVPATFRVRLGHGGRLDNHSATFWTS